MNDNKIKGIFDSENIEYFAALPNPAVNFRRPDLVARDGVAPESIKTAIVFLIPYYVDDGEGNISLYARSLDYHLYCSELFPRIINKLEAAYGGVFLGYADKSPVEETDAAAKAGLGVHGDNYMLLNEKYGSFVFIGEILTTIEPEKFGEVREKYEPSYCNHCGACKKACPMKQDDMPCLSAVTQKKGELDGKEKNYILKYGSAWGCDICQLACPIVKKAVESGQAVTPIPFFRENRIARLTADMVMGMDEKTFLSRAFSWRGKNTVIRNLRLFEKK